MKQRFIQPCFNTEIDKFVTGRSLRFHEGKGGIVFASVAGSNRVTLRELIYTPCTPWNSVLRSFVLNLKFAHITLQLLR